MPEPAFPAITPYLLYEDVPAALEWLSSAFGFKERLRFTGDDGTVNHAEMVLGDGVVMMGDPGPQYRGPKKLGGVTVQLYVYVDDVDAHHQHAKEAGAPILRELKDEEYGDRRYDSEDPEGHRWSFAQHKTDVASSDWGATES
jgi:PhnB protein